MSDYIEFIRTKSKGVKSAGFAPHWMPDFLYDFQSYLCDWSIRLGRSAILADCGMGKTPMQLVIAQNFIEETNKPALICTPIAVGAQTIAEAAKFGITAKRTRDGKMTDEKCIWVTNYEQLHKYDPKKFGAVIDDESGCIKDAKTERKKSVVDFNRQVKYRLLCTATAAPNDYWELGSSSEALGYLGFRDMITNFFKQETSKDHHGWGRTKYRFRGHAEQPFWSWVCSWARSLRRPSDLGFDDTRFILPELIETDYVIDTAQPRPGVLITVPAKDIREERAERRHSIRERCEKAVEIAQRPGPAALWVELNPEGDMLEKMLDDCVQVSGSMSDDAKEEALIAFGAGQIRRLICKPKIGAWGLNWQHCSNVISMPSHSYEQYYQLVRRCYRYGQQNPVEVSRIVCEGEVGVLHSLARKQGQGEAMFSNIVAHMNNAMHLASMDFFPEEELIPAWL